MTSVKDRMEVTESRQQKSKKAKKVRARCKEKKSKEKKNPFTIPNLFFSEESFLKKSFFFWNFY
jgi:hypothetical protein